MQNIAWMWRRERKDLDHLQESLHNIVAILVLSQLQHTIQIQQLNYYVLHLWSVQQYLHNMASMLVHGYLIIECFQIITYNIQNGRATVLYGILKNKVPAGQCKKKCISYLNVKSLSFYLAWHMYVGDQALPKLVHGKI